MSQFKLKTSRSTALAFAACALTGLGSASVFLLLESAQAAGSQTFRLEFKAGGEDVLLDLVTDTVLTTINVPDPPTPPTPPLPAPNGYTFTGYTILGVSGTDGGQPIVGLKPVGTNLMPALVQGIPTFGSDNLFNYLGGSAPNQLSNGAFGGGLVYTTDEGGGMLKDYQFYFGLNPDIVGGGPLDFQGCVTPPYSPPSSPSGCGPLIITEFKSSVPVPAPLPVLGAGLAFGSLGKLKRFSSQLKRQPLT